MVLIPWHLIRTIGHHPIGGLKKVQDNLPVRPALTPEKKETICCEGFMILMGGRNLARDVHIGIVVDAGGVDIEHFSPEDFF
jgi:hypothetical protein